MTAISKQGPLGLIIPFETGVHPQDAAKLYPHTRFIARSLAASAIDLANYDHVIDRVADLALELALDGAVAISLMSTTLSFYRGADFNRQLMRLMYKASNRPCSTMSQALLNALEAVGAQKLALATVYTPAVNQSLIEFLAENGYSTSGVQGLELSDLPAIQALDTDTLVQLCHRVWHAHGPADALVLASGGFNTLAAVKQVSQDLGIPVLSSSAVGFWDVLRTAGLDSRAPGWGDVFELPPPAGPRRN